MARADWTRGCIRATVQLLYLGTCPRGEEVGKDEVKGRHGTRPVPVSWHEMWVNNTSPKYIRSRHSQSDVSDKRFAQIVAIKLFSLAR